MFGVHVWRDGWVGILVHWLGILPVEGLLLHQQLNRVHFDADLFLVLGLLWRVTLVAGTGVLVVGERARGLGGARRRRRRRLLRTTAIFDDRLAKQLGFEERARPF